MDDAGLQGSDEYPFALLDWLETGDLEARALSTKAGAGHHTNARVPKQVWAEARKTLGGIDFHGEGAAKAKIVVGRDEDNAGELVTITARGISVRADQLAQLAPAAVNSPLRLAVVDTASMEAPRSGAGRKRDIERWKLFWFSVIELGRDQRLVPGSFESARALSDEILQMMGKAAFSEGYVKVEVGQIYKKFVE